MKLRKTGIFTKIVIIALAAYAIVSLLSLKSRLAQAEAYQAKLEEEVSRAELENAGLSYEIEHSADDSTIEDIARDKLGLVKPGEKIFYDVGN